MLQCKTKWTSKTIENCCDILDSKRIPINEEERDSLKGNIPYYGANGLQGYINDYIFNDDLILLAEDGGYFDEYETRPIAYKISGKSWVNNHAHILKPKNSYNFNYIFYNLEHKNILYYINGGTRAKLTQEELKKIRINIIDDYDIQSKIANILSTCDEVIEKTEEAIEKYKQIKAGMMQDLFTRGLDENGKLRPTYAKAPDLYKYSEELDRYIPKDWDIINKLEDCTIKIGDGIHTTPKYCENSNFYFVNGNNLVDDKINTDNNANNIPESEYNRYKPILNECTLLLSINGTIGNLAFYNNDNVVFGKSICYICCKNKYTLDYLYHYFQTDYIKAFYDYELTGSTIKNLSLNSIRNLKFAIPKTEKEISDIAKVLYKIHKKIKKEEQYLNKYKQIKQGLMKRLLTPPVDAEIVEE